MRSLLVNERGLYRGRNHNSTAHPIKYLPFGEVFIEERNNSWNTPYLFNSKELDEETGLYYYGARYYNPRESIWLSVDPLFEKTMTPYQYTYQNPLKFIDPTGMKGEDIIIRGKDNHTRTIKAPGEDQTVNLPVNLDNNKNVDLGLSGEIDPGRFVVGYTVNAGIEGSLGLGVSGNVNLIVSQFTDPTYAGYNYVYAGAEQGGSAGAQLSISANVGVDVFVGYNTDDEKINPKEFAKDSYTVNFSADIKAVVGGGGSSSVFSGTPKFTDKGWKGISLGLNVGVGESTNLVSAGASRGYTYLLNDVKPTSQRGMIDRVTNRISPIPSSLVNYGIRKAQQLLR
jgi:RHS repeat-associated protein